MNNQSTINLENGYTGQIFLEGGEVLTVNNGFLSCAIKDGKPVESKPTKESFAEAYAKGITDKINLDSKTTVTFEHGRFMKVEIKD